MRELHSGGMLTSAFNDRCQRHREEISPSAIGCASWLGDVANLWAIQKKARRVPGFFGVAVLLDQLKRQISSALAKRPMPAPEYR